MASAGWPSASFVLLAALFLVLLIAGGASRADAPGQAWIRSLVPLILAVWICIVPRPIRVVRPVAVIVAAVCALPALQLIPLPPAIWTALPGRELFVPSADLLQVSQPWRPLAIVPGATINALFSLIVPVAVLLLASNCRPDERPKILVALVAMISATALLEIVQFAGSGLANPLVDSRPGYPSGVFANRNHQAVFLAIGLLAVPVLAAGSTRRGTGRIWGAIGGTVLLMLMLLATGSRGGLLVGALALLLLPVLLGRPLWRGIKTMPLWMRIGGGAVLIPVVIGLGLLSMWAGRSESLDRLREADVSADLRARALPTVLQMARDYFPMGSGAGSFDPLFRIREPFDLLKYTYFNQAHNDIVDLAITGGIPALLIFAGAMGWWLLRSIPAWRTGGDRSARLGSAMILLTVIASLFDYPARTPLFMAILVVAAIWLAGARTKSTLTHRQAPSIAQADFP